MFQLPYCSLHEQWIERLEEDIETPDATQNLPYYYTPDIGHWYKYTTHDVAIELFSYKQYIECDYEPQTSRARFISKHAILLRHFLTAISQPDHAPTFLSNALDLAVNPKRIKIEPRQLYGPGIYFEMNAYYQQ